MKVIGITLMIAGLVVFLAVAGSPTNASIAKVLGILLGSVCVSGTGVLIASVGKRKKGETRDADQDTKVV